MSSPFSGIAIIVAPFHIQIWRERVFLLIARPDFQFFEASTSESNILNLTRSRFLNYRSNPISFFPMISLPLSFELRRQGFQMLSTEQLRSLPAKAWMAQSAKPKLHTWLANSQTAGDRDRLCAVGNVVVPEMGYIAMHILAGIWAPTK